MAAADPDDLAILLKVSEGAADERERERVDLANRICQGVLKILGG